MNQNGMYYVTDEFKQLIRNLGGEWNDQKKRPIVCLIQSSENPELYWAIPVGKVNHRDQEGMNRIRFFMSRPDRDLRSCYYHVGRTTSKSIFFISDCAELTLDINALVYFVTSVYLFNVLKRDAELSNLAVSFCKSS